MSDKDRMDTCDVTYSEEDNSNDTILISPFIPARRTFLLTSLKPDKVRFAAKLLLP